MSHSEIALPRLREFMDRFLHPEILRYGYLILACDLLRKEGEASPGLRPELCLMPDIREYLL